MSEIDSKVKRVKPLLIVGIVLMPLIFVWFLFEKGYSLVAKQVGFAWLAFIISFQSMRLLEVWGGDLLLIMPLSYGIACLVYYLSGKLIESIDEKIGEADREEDLIQFKADIEKETKQVKERVIKGDAMSRDILGSYYKMGQGVDEDAAVKWHSLAANQGDAKAQAFLGYMYDYGLGAVQDYKEAARWYQLAAEQGLASAQFCLGSIYYYGQGVVKDYKEALRWYRLAAEQGLACAQGNLGIMYTIGKGVEHDYKEAVRWYQLAAEQGDSNAQLNLGSMYTDGLGVVQDYKEALRWYRLAAEQGYAKALLTMGSMYTDGLGVVQNDEQAYYWWLLACANLDSKLLYASASKNRDIVVKKLNATQIARIQKEAQTWLESHR